MFEVSYVKEEGVSIKKHERVYAKETWYATNIFKEWYAFLWFATKHSPKRHKNVVTTRENKWNSEVWVMMQNRWWKRFWQFNEMLQKAKEGKSVLYASMLWSFEIRYIDNKKERIELNNFDLCTKPIMILDDVEKVTKQMQNFWYKPWENRNRKKRPKTTAEALQDLNNEFKKMFTEIAKHKRSFFDFALWIIVWTAIWWYFICFLWR